MELRRAIRRAMVLTSALLTTAAVCGAAPAWSLDLRGTITAHEVSTVDGDGGTRDVTVRWTVGGTLLPDGSSTVATTAPQVVSFSDRLLGTSDSGPTCGEVVLGSMLTGDGVLTTHDLFVTASPKDLVSGTDVATMRFSDVSPSFAMSSGDCGGPYSATEPWRMVGNDNQGDGVVSAFSVIGMGNLTASTSLGTTTTSPSTYLLPDRLVFRHSRSGWGSTGSVRRTGRWNTGGLGAGERTVDISWSLVSTSLTNSCALPRRALVRGRTVAAVTRALAARGLRRGTVIKVAAAGVPRGRVVAIAASLRGDDAGRRCGSRVNLLVRR